MKGHDRATLRELPVKDLQVQLQETEQKLMKLRFANGIAPIKNGLDIRNLRRQRARLLTWIRSKELAGAAKAKKG